MAGIVAERTVRVQRYTEEGLDHSPCLKAGDSWAEHCEPDRGALP